jgi:predicted metal-dependent hydrolase
MGISYQRIAIRGQKTRWGSCSRKKNLSFNWKLIMAPGSVVEYVIIHELLHLKEMNHSKRFWELVARYCPGWRENKKWLKQHEADLTSKLCAPSPLQTPHQLPLVQVGN